jgi:uncharacterized protein YndB with AHSA1/START domain
MPFVATAERTLDVPPDAAFDRLANHASWEAWMPPSFRPVGKIRETLRGGDSIQVRIDGMPLPAKLVISVSARPEEIAWRGGIRSLLWAEHRFLFEAREGGTRVRSVETWHGPLAGLLRRASQPKAERIGREQLEGLAQSLREKPSA